MPSACARTEGSTYAQPDTTTAPIITAMTSASSIGSSPQSSAVRYIVSLRMGREHIMLTLRLEYMKLNMAMAMAAPAGMATRTQLSAQLSTRAFASA